jgi:hypothetical protein
MEVIPPAAVVFTRAASNHISPMRERGNNVRPSLALRASVRCSRGRRENGWRPGFWYATTKRPVPSA